MFVKPGDARALANAIRLLEADRKRARNMGLAGRQYLEQNFSREAIGQRLMDVLESTLSGRSSHA